MDRSNTALLEAENNAITSYTIAPEIANMIRAGEDLSTEQLGLSVRSCNCLAHAHITKLSELLLLDGEQIASMHGVGAKSFNEIAGLIYAVKKLYETHTVSDKKREILNIIKGALSDEAVKASPQVVNEILTLKDKVLCCEEDDKLPDIESIGQLWDYTAFSWAKYIYTEFGTDAFCGINADSAGRLLPKEFPAATLNKGLNALVRSGKLRLEGDKFFPVCPDVYDAINKIKNERLRKTLLLHLSGLSLEQIGYQLGGITRSRVEQIENEAWTAVYEISLVLKEDEYKSFYEKYEVDKEHFRDIFGTKEYVFRYLKIRYKHGREPFTAAPDDTELPESVRRQVKSYLTWGEKEKTAPKKAVKVLEKKKKEPKQTAFFASDPSVREINRKIGTPVKAKAYKNLLSKIKNSFDKKYYIGDIPIKDEEYEVLKAYAAVMYEKMLEHKLPLSDCPVLAVALVQIGIKKYNGKYWPHVEAEILESIPPHKQKYFGDSFINTMKAHNKAFISESDMVASIMFHTFVSDYYSKGLFALLFQYFKNDLERDINRNDKDQMNALMETLTTKAELGEEASEAFTDQFMEKGSRAYKLRQHTLQAICTAPGKSSMRLRRIIRNIDEAFWNDKLPKNPVSRLTKLYVQWVEESEEFKKEYRRYKQGEIRNRGKKHFSAPYLFVNIAQDKFRVMLPAQIVKESYAENLKWKITTNQGTYFRDTETIPVLTGFKTDDCYISISTEEIFGEITSELIWGNDTVVKKYSNLPASKVRFFDLDGDYAPRLFKIPMVAYSRAGAVLESPALMGKLCGEEYTRWEFEFEDGDIVILPDGDSMVVGEKFSDGFIKRGLVSGALCTSTEGEKIAVYSKLPDLILTIPKSKINGTAIDVNGVKHRLGDCKYTEFESADSKGCRAFFVPTDQFKECRNNTINTVLLDIPKSTFVKEYIFAYINGLSVNYDGAPYVFEERGTICFPDDIKAKCSDKRVEQLFGENGFSFELTGERTTLPMRINGKLNLEFKIPVLLWSTDNETWKTEPLGEIWSTDFFKIKTLYFKSPEKKIELVTDSDTDDDEIQAVTAEKRADNTFLLDMTRFMSWITRDKIAHNITIKVGSKEYAFATVYAKSYVVNCDVAADYEEGILTCTGDIIGQSQYYIDILHMNTGRVIADKQRFAGNEFSVKDKLSTGDYRIEIFEAEDDDSGFDDLTYYSIFECTKKLINKSDLSGHYLHIRKFKPSVGTYIFTNFACEYWVTDFEKAGKGIYEGVLLEDGIQTGLKVQVEFTDTDNLRYFNVSFWDEYEEAYIDFMFDAAKKMLIQEEAEGLSAAKRYRRYKMLFADDFIFYGTLEDKLPEEYRQ